MSGSLRSHSVDELYRSINYTQTPRKFLVAFFHVENRIQRKL